MANLLLIVADELVDLAKEAATIKSDVLPPKAAALTQPLSAFAPGAANAVVNWPLTQKETAALDGYALDIAASESLTFNAADKWADGDPANGKFLSIAAAGDISLEGKATIPSALGKWGVDAQASTKIDLAYFFQRPDSDLYGKAVADCLLRLPNPFDLSSMWARAQEADFQGVRFSFDGAVKLKVEVTVADALGLATEGVDVGVDVSVSAGVDSKYTLELRKIVQRGAPALHAELSRAQVTDSDFSASIGVEVDLSKLTQGVSAALATLVKVWDAKLDPIKPFLSPGTWLQTQADAKVTKAIGDLVKDKDLQQALIGDAEAVLGIKALEPTALETWINEALGAAIDRSSVLITNDMANALAPVLGELAKVAPSLSAAAQSRLTQLVADGLAAIDKEFKAVVGDLTPFGPDLVKALNKAGVTVSGVVDTLDKALAPIRALLTKVDTQFHAVFDKAQTALKQKVAAKLSLENNRSDSAVVEVAGLFTGNTPEAGRILQLLTLGRLSALADMVEGGQTVPGFTLGDGTVTRLIQTKEKQGLDITFLDFTLSWSELVTTSTKTIVDSNGNVRVLSEGDVTKEMTTPFSTTRGAAFVDSYSLVQAGMTHADPNAGPPVLQMGVEAYFNDSSLVWAKIDDFMHSLDTFDLISSEAHGKIRAVFNSWAGPSAKINGRLSASLRLSGNQIATLLPSASPSPGYQQQIVAVAYAAEVRGPDLDANLFRQGKPLVQNEFAKPHPPSMSYAQVVLAMYDQLHGTVAEPDSWTEGTPSGATEIPFDAIPAFKEFVSKGYILEHLVDLVGSMNALYYATAKANSGAGGWSADDYEKAQQKIVDDAAIWLTTTPPVIEFFGGRITRRTLAFMRALADLAGMPGQPAVTLTLTSDAPDGKMRVAAFQ